MNELLHKFKLGNDAELLLEKRGGGYEKVATVPIGSQALTVRNSAQGVVKGIAPSGTVAVNGTITLGTALPAVFSAGLRLYLPAGAIVGGDEGFYWSEMSSTTVGVVREQFGGAALTGSGSSYAGVTSEVTLRSEFLAGAENFSINAQFSISNSAGIKTSRIRIGEAQGLLATATNNIGLGFGANISKISSGVCVSNSVANGSTGSIAFVPFDPVEPATITGQMSAPTDFILLVSSRVLVGG